ncbi:MAG: acyltransferase [Acidobacteriota bacterium]
MNPQYRPELDGLRALAILAVLGLHAGVPLFRGGGLGVDVFFVLSGYLITSILLRERANLGSIGLKRFYLRRVLRLFPALFVLLACATAYAYFFQVNPERSETYGFVLYTLFYVANWARSFGVSHPWLGHCWSLSVEEQFYLIWPPLLVLLTSKLSVRRTLIVTLGLILAVIVHRAWLWTGPLSFDRLYNGLDTRGDSLLIGCGLALLHAGGLRPANKFWALACGALLALGVMFGHLLPVELLLRYGGVTIIAAAAACVLSTVLVTPPAFLSLRPLVWVGKLSYSLYLWHLPAIHMVGWRAGWHEWQLIPLRLALSFVLAVVSYYFIELPFLELKNRRLAVPSRKEVNRDQHDRAGDLKPVA